MTALAAGQAITPAVSTRRFVAGGGFGAAAVIGLVLAVLAGAAVAGCGAAGSSAEDSGIIALPTPNSPLVTLRIGFRTGSVDDPAGKNGLNALTAMMMGRGGTEALSFQEITEALYPWSASIRAQSDKEMTVLVGEVHRDHLSVLRHRARLGGGTAVRRIGLRPEPGLPDQHRRFHAAR